MKDVRLAFHHAGRAAHIQRRRQVGGLNVPGGRIGEVVLVGGGGDCIKLLSVLIYMAQRLSRAIGDGGACAIAPGDDDRSNALVTRIPGIDRQMEWPPLHRLARPAFLRRAIGRVEIIVGVCICVRQTKDRKHIIDHDGNG
jgi:hypothetical protein